MIDGARLPLKRKEREESDAAKVQTLKHLHSGKARKEYQWTPEEITKGKSGVNTSLTLPGRLL